MDVIISFAVKEEMFDISFPNIRTVLTGVGKANAAYRLTKAISAGRPDIVINIGTAGAKDYSVGDILVSKHFVDRDLTPLEIEGVEVEIETQCHLNLPSIIGCDKRTCGCIVNSGDDFVTADEAFVGDVVDMEAFALASVCKNEGINFVAVKYITDIIGQNSVKHWNEKLICANAALHEYFNNHIMPEIV